ncbi:glycerophosphodiester phosphodiesterase family protein [Alkalimonas sp.]|uniref:glycerophosphodiester phosphodiesterase family protein n=1 Tax=Alkalimonas sp. TaxID=1872453 RepID=UPI00263BA4F7|nr:glycerophosphodiester phosphodiesterase family protein [Alkalimonas sp.]MCC5824602.1 hypothetical protein [Alkalimonas sp.]
MDKQVAPEQGCSGYFGASSFDCAKVKIGDRVSSLTLCLPSDKPRYLSLDGIEFYAAGEKVAFSQASYQLEQSSVDRERGPEFLLQKKRIHTQRELAPFWRIRFVRPVYLSEVWLFNRHDAFAKRNAALCVHYETETGERIPVRFTPQQSLAAIVRQSWLASSKPQREDALWQFIQHSKTAGCSGLDYQTHYCGSRYFGHSQQTAAHIQLSMDVVSIELTFDDEAPRFLSLDGIELWQDSQLYKPEPDNQRVSQSSVHKKRGPERLLKQKRIHTMQDVRPYWKLEFASPTRLDAIRLINRNDTYARRNSGLVCHIQDAQGQLLVYKTDIAPSFCEHYFQQQSTLAPQLALALMAHAIRSDIVDIFALDWCALLNYLDIWNDAEPLHPDEAIILAAYAITAKKHGQSRLKVMAARLQTTKAIELLESAVNQVSEALGLGHYGVSKHGLVRANLIADSERYLASIEAFLATLITLGYQGFLCYGTLLGARRENAFLAHDDDVDLAVMLNAQDEAAMQAEFATLLEALQQHGYRVHHNSRFSNVHVTKKGLKRLDIFPCWQDERGVHLLMDKMKSRSLPADIILPLAQITFQHYQFPCPAQTDAFLVERYGVGWQQPDKFHEWPWPLQDTEKPNQVSKVPETLAALIQPEALCTKLAEQLTNHGLDIKAWWKHPFLCVLDCQLGDVCLAFELHSALPGWLLLVAVNRETNQLEALFPKTAQCPTGLGYWQALSAPQPWLAELVTCILTAQERYKTQRYVAFIAEGYDDEHLKQPAQWARQGGAGYAVGNTLAAIEQTVRLGCKVLELDVQLSQDGELVIHDEAWLDYRHSRTVEGDWLTPADAVAIGDLSWQALQHYQLGEPNPASDYKASRRRLMAVPGQRIPSLRQVIQLLQSTSSDTTLLLDLKTDVLAKEPEQWQPLARQLLKVLHEEAFLSRVSFTSLDWRALGYIKSAHPDAVVWFATHPFGWLEASYSEHQALPVDTRLLADLRQSWQSGKAAWYAGHQPQSLQDIPKAIRQAGGDGWLCHYSDLLEHQVHLVTDGLPLAVWADNLRDPQRISTLKRAGITALCHDYPASHFIRLSPEGRAWVQEGNLLLKSHQWQRLKEHYLPWYQAAVPCAFEVYYQLAIALRKLDEQDASEQVLLAGLQAFPNHHNLYIELAVLENQRENWSKALVFWQQAFHIGGAFSLHSYQRCARAIVMHALSAPPEDWHRALLARALPVAIEHQAFMSCYLLFDVLSLAQSGSLTTACQRLSNLAETKILERNALPYLYVLRGWQLQLNKLELERWMQTDPVKLNAYLCSDKPTRLMPQDIADLCFMLQQRQNTDSAGQASWLTTMLQALQPLQALSLHTSGNLCKRDAWQHPQIQAVAQQLTALVNLSDMRADLLPSNGWKTLANIFLLVFDIRCYSLARELAFKALRFEQGVASDEPCYADTVIPASLPLEALPGTQQKRLLPLLAVHGKHAEFAAAFADYQQQDFASYLHGKRVAVVGPVNVGLQQDAEIDAFDVVIRLNYRGVEPLTGNGAGSKTQVSYYANDVIRGEGSSESIRLAMQQLDWVVFDTESNQDKEFTVANCRFNFPYRDFNPLSKGVVNAIQKVILDLCLYQPACIKVFNANLWLSQSEIPGYHVGYARNTVSRFIWHDPAANFLFMQNAWQNGIIEADPVLSQILSMSLNDYLRQLDHAIQG